MTNWYKKQQIERVKANLYLFAALAVIFLILTLLDYIGVIELTEAMPR